MSPKVKETEYKSFSQVLIVSCVVSLGSITYSFQMNSMNDALATLMIVFEISRQWQSLFEGLLTSSVFIGTFIGALSCSFLLKYSLKSVIIILDIFMICGSLLQTIPNAYLFLLGRLISGLGAGMHSIIVPLFLKQIVPKELFGMMVGLCQMTWAVAYMLTEAFGIILELPDNATKLDINFNILKIYFFAPSVFSITRVLLFTTMRIESPQYYMEQNDPIKAEEVIKKIYKREYVQSILDNLQQQKDKIDQKVDIFSDALKIRFRLALSINCLCALSGVGNVLQYSTSLFRAVTSHRIALLLTLLISVLKVVSFSTSSIVSQKVGRRKPYLIGNGIMCFSLMGIGTLSIIAEQLTLSKDNLQYLIYSSLFLVFVYLLATFNSLSFLASVYIPEIVPGQGVAMAFQSYWFLNIVTLFGFPYVVQQVGISTCFFFFGFCTLGGQLILYKYALETANKNETEIDEMFENLRIGHKRKPTQIQESLTADIGDETIVDQYSSKYKTAYK